MMLTVCMYTGSLAYANFTSNFHCLNKRERPLHSERNSILRDEPNIEAKYPALIMAG